MPNLSWIGNNARKGVAVLDLSDYAHPRDVVEDRRLSACEKRKLLSAWASDACAVESKPSFRWMPGTPGPIIIDHILSALRALDGVENEAEPLYSSPATTTVLPWRNTAPLPSQSRAV